MTAPFSKETIGLTNSVKNILYLAQIPFKCVLIEAHNGIRKKDNMKFRQIGHKTSQYEQSFPLKRLVYGTGLCDCILISIIINVNPFRIIP